MKTLHGVENQSDKSALCCVYYTHPSSSTRESPLWHGPVHMQVLNLTGYSSFTREIHRNAGEILQVSYFFDTDSMFDELSMNVFPVIVLCTCTCQCPNITRLTVL